MSHFGVESFPLDRQLYIIIFTVIAFYPLSLLKNLRSLRYTSALGIIAIFYIFGLLMYHATKLYHHNHKTAEYLKCELSYLDLTSGIFMVVDVCGKAFIVQALIPPLYHDLENRNVNKMSKIVVISCIMVTLLYVLFGTAGYYLYGDTVSSDIINSINGGIEISIARLSVVIVLIAAYPMNMKAAIVAIEDKCFNPIKSEWNFNNISWLRPMVITICVFILCVISLFVDNLGAVSSVEGALSILIVTLPILIIWNLGFVSANKRSMSYRANRKNDASKSIMDVLKTLNDNVENPLLYESIDSKMSRCSSNSSTIVIALGWKSKILLIIMFLFGISACCFGIYQCFI